MQSSLNWRQMGWVAAAIFILHPLLDMWFGDPASQPAHLIYGALRAAGSACVGLIAYDLWRRGWRRRAGTEGLLSARRD